MNYSQRLPSRPHQLFLIVAFTVLVLLNACGRGGGGDPLQFGDQTVLTGNAFVVCTAECADRAQCGVTADGSRVVLAHNGPDPALRGHNSFIPHQTPVVIGPTRAEPVVQTIDNTQFSVNFYTVTNQELLRTGWVAGWCVANRLP